LLSPSSSVLTAYDENVQFSPATPLSSITSAPPSSLTSPNTNSATKNNTQTNVVSTSKNTTTNNQFDFTTHPTNTSGENNHINFETPKRDDIISVVENVNGQIKLNEEQEKTLTQTPNVTETTTKQPSVFQNEMIKNLVTRESSQNRVSYEDDSQPKEFIIEAMTPNINKTVEKNENKHQKQNEQQKEHQNEVFSSKESDQTNEQIMKHDIQQPTNLQTNGIKNTKANTQIPNENSHPQTNVEAEPQQITNIHANQQIQETQTQTNTQTNDDYAKQLKVLRETLRQREMHLEKIISDNSTLREENNSLQT
jgi:hypothetical protein